MRLSTDVEPTLTGYRHSLRRHIEKKQRWLIEAGIDAQITVEPFAGALSFHYFDLPTSMMADLCMDKVATLDLFPSIPQPQITPWRVGSIAKARFDNFPLYGESKQPRLIQERTPPPTGEHFCQRFIEGLLIMAATAGDEFAARACVPVPEEIVRRAEAYNAQVWAHVEAHTHLIRCDYILERSTGCLYLLDINLRPFVHPTAYRLWPHGHWHSEERELFTTYTAEVTTMTNLTKSLGSIQDGEGGE